MYKPKCTWNQIQVGALKGVEVTLSMIASGTYT